MAHADQFEFVKLVKQYLPAFFEGSSVLEIGSSDINGSVRSFFSGAKSYTGVDVAEGPGVDKVCQGQLIDYPTGTFDVVISCECMEHNPFWIETISNMFRMVKPAGLMIISCATIGRAEHGTSRTTVNSSPLSVGIGWEYYRNVSIQDFKRAFTLNNWCEDYVLLANWHNCDLYFVGIRKPLPGKNTLKLLREALGERFKARQSMRSLCVSIAANLLGESGVSVLRMFWRLRPRAS
jgi:SAM-dependent methyltransferase